MSATVPPQPARADRPDGDLTRVPWGAVALYTGLAVGLGWLVSLPLWLGKGLQDPAFTLYALALMYTPTIAALVTTFTLVRPRHPARFLGLTPFKPVWRSILVILAWPLVWLAVGFGAMFLAAGLGWVSLDFGLEAASQSLGGESAQTIVLISFLTLPLVVIQGSLAAFGEELGWRGFLVPALAPLGFWRMSLVSGIIWGLWHAPLILLGYNFARTDVTGLLWMCGFTLVVGTVLNMARLWCRNVWVAAVGHGAMNAVAPVTLMFIADPTGVDPAFGTMLGIPGWVSCGILIAILAAAGLAGRRLPRPLVTTPAKELERAATRS